MTDIKKLREHKVSLKMGLSGSEVKMNITRLSLKGSGDTTNVSREIKHSIGMGAKNFY